jgi:hypothetical protein
MDDVSRRRFLGAVLAAPVVVGLARDGQAGSGNAQPLPAIPESFPRQDPSIAREIVGASHNNLERVKELVSARPALARASWDWGYGDWETALGAASHVGTKEIAAVLLAAGAHPTIFSAAMLGQLAAVKALVAAAPGIQRIPGPHGLSLLHHAKAGESDEVVKYLESLGDAYTKYPNEPLIAGDPEGLVGTYTFGRNPTDRLVVSVNARGVLRVKREGQGEQNLFHHGGRVFNPSGAEAVRLRFEPLSGRATILVIVDGPLQLRASRA